MVRRDASVLLVGEGLSRGGVRRALEALGAGRVDSVPDGATALQALSTLRFDLVITAWRLPDMGGATLLHRIRHTLGLGLLPVVVAVPFAREVVAEAAESGVSGFVSEPLRYEALEALLQVFVGRGQASPHASVRG